jgi:HPt (histidine-containing phosphotransfer) domain-containing protein
MNISPAPQYLSVERAMDFIGDEAGVRTLLHTLHQTLGDDLPRIAAHLEAGDVQSVNFLLHQLKGFAPVFCVDPLVKLVVQVEHLSKAGAASEVRAAYQVLAPQLALLREEVATHLGRSSDGSQAGN